MSLSGFSSPTIHSSLTKLRCRSFCAIAFRWSRSVASPKKAGEFSEPRYDHPEFQKAFAELNDLLAAQFEGDPLIEWMDLMQYGFWGEGHTSNYPSPFPDYLDRGEDLRQHDGSPTRDLEENPASGQHATGYQ